VVDSCIMKILKAFDEEGSFEEREDVSSAITF
jgi:hypothetical protein